MFRETFIFSKVAFCWNRTNPYLSSPLGGGNDFAGGEHTTRHDLKGSDFAHPFFVSVVVKVVI